MDIKLIKVVLYDRDRENFEWTWPSPIGSSIMAVGQWADLRYGCKIAPRLGPVQVDLVSFN